MPFDRYPESSSTRDSDKAQIMAANQTLHVFTGGNQPFWMLTDNLPQSSFRPAVVHSKCADTPPATNGDKQGMGACARPQTAPPTMPAATKLGGKILDEWYVQPADFDDAARTTVRKVTVHSCAILLY
jgi:hypothetical protein